MQRVTDREPGPESLTQPSLAKSTHDPHLKTHRPGREEDAHPLPPASPGERLHGQAKAKPGQNLERR